jgi:AcrR family transcriptional regulator
MKKVITEEYSQTEQLIIDAARDVFSRKGFQGARMQEIAEFADINKALLHYYFRNKKKLFEKVFEKVISELKENLFNVEIQTDSIEEILYYFAENYIDFFKKNQFIPQFIIQEIRENPDWIIKHFNKLKIMETKLFQTLISKINPSGNSMDLFYDIMLNMISLLVFPIIAKPVIQSILKVSDSDFEQMIENRKKSVPELILRSYPIRGGNYEK